MDATAVSSPGIRTLRAIEIGMLHDIELSRVAANPLAAVTWKDLAARPMPQAHVPPAQLPISVVATLARTSWTAMRPARA